MIDVRLALEYLHHDHSSAPVINCDLKPSNILLDENMFVNIMHSALDFCMESPEQQAYTKDAVEKLKKIIIAKRHVSTNGITSV
ncbi:hypothetical protein CUMW_256590 [Citrus unshiu]|uniref:Protein kinase domain-containing protein n=1 Tax=Citrus unshiu TaxID=55188 RepID=A0A2H5QT49_CITUN|nr:hypothetical protein CUMW_256590 [Citrus unshiu]GAY67455.1 hypothetical protein CUMW_256590 [Citrus unshiu]